MKCWLDSAVHWGCECLWSFSDWALCFCIQLPPKHNKSSAECFWKRHCLLGAIYLQAASTKWDLARFCWMPVLAKHISTAAQDTGAEWQDWICLTVLYIYIYRKDRQNQTSAAAPEKRERRSKGRSWPAAVSPTCGENKAELPILYHSVPIPGFWQMGAVLQVAAGSVYLEWSSC